MSEICYFKKIVETESRGGIAFLRRFELDVERCQKICLGYDTSCGKYINQNDVLEGGLVRLVKK